MTQHAVLGGLMLREIGTPLLSGYKAFRLQTCRLPKLDTLTLNRPRPELRASNLKSYTLQPCVPKPESDGCVI